ncbi:MAG TPA: CBS domain-containing protein [Rubrivivax sp.]|nr:CBS domain-containing protein [Rubrivivax sp.]
MHTVAQILQGKPDQAVYTLAPTVSAHEAVRLMVDKNIGALVIVEGGRVVGLFSERDCVRKLVLTARPAPQTRLGELMDSPVMYVRPDQTSDECMALMTQHRLRHLPVLDAGGQLIGLVSIGDLVKATIADHQFIIEQLEHYISGERH